MATGNLIRVGLAGFYGPEPVVTTFGLIEGSPPGPGLNHLADMAASVEAALGGAFAQIAGFNVNWNIQTIICQDITPGTAPEFQLPVSHSGDISTNGVPPQVSINVKWGTGLKGPANRGRMFLPGGVASANFNGFWTSDMIDPASTFASLIFDKYVSDGTEGQLVVISYVPGSTPRVVRAAVPVTSFTIDNVARTQRRREVGTRIHRAS